MISARLCATAAGLLLATALVFSSGACSAPARTAPEQGRSGAPTGLTSRDSAEARARGSSLFAAHCAVCHGSEGRADGPASLQLFPPPRDFARARFRLVSTENGVPLPDDIVRTLRRGIPGSAMPSWSWLPERDLWFLAEHVRELAVQGLGERLALEAEEHGARVSLAEAVATARARLTPGARIVVGPPAEPDEATLALGREVYLANCAACHGEDGRGSDTPRFDEDGSLNWPRDFTAGWLKGDASHEDLAWRIRTGLPGTAMPATDIPRDEHAALVAYVRSLIPPGTEARWVQLRQTVTAERVAGAAIPASDDARWNAADPVDVVLAPLWKRDESIHEAELRALHDGERLYVRVRWSDDTQNDNPLEDLEAPDGVALQLSRDDAPALFGMGSPEHPTVIWHWKAVELKALDETLERLPPHVTGSGWSTSRTTLPEGAPEAVQWATLYRATSLEDGTPLVERDDDAAVLPHHAEGAWSVVFALPLGAPDHDEALLLEPGSRLQLACAVWNGAAGDFLAQKSISIWHELVLAP